MRAHRFGHQPETKQQRLQREIRELETKAGIRPGPKPPTGSGGIRPVDKTHTEQGDAHG